MIAPACEAIASKRKLTYCLMKPKLPEEWVIGTFCSTRPSKSLISIRVTRTSEAALRRPEAGAHFIIIVCASHRRLPAPRLLDEGMREGNDRAVTPDQYGLPVRFVSFSCRAACLWQEPSIEASTACCMNEPEPRCKR